MNELNIEKSSAPMLKLGEISELLGFTVTAEFLHTLGFEPAAKERASKLYLQTDFIVLCDALAKHIKNVQAIELAKQT